MKFNKLSFLCSLIFSWIISITFLLSACHLSPLKFQAFREKKRCIKLQIRSDRTWISFGLKPDRLYIRVYLSCVWVFNSYTEIILVFSKARDKSCILIKCAVAFYLGLSGTLKQIFFIYILIVNAQAENSDLYYAGSYEPFRGIGMVWSSSAG